MKIFYSPLLRPVVKTVIFIFIGFMAIQPYNWICKASDKCEGFYLVDLFDLLPKFGKKVQANILVDVVNNREALTLEALEVVAARNIDGSIQSFQFKAKNNTNSNLEFELDFFVEPRTLEKYIIKRHCLCSARQKLKPNQEKILTMKLKIDNDIIDDSNFRVDEGLRIGYRVKNF
jgi:cytochrome c oxidase assembly protein Cox11